MAEPATYLTPEAQARVEIDKMLELAGWVVQDADKANLAAGRGVAVREFILEAGHGRADYLLFVDRKAVGVLEAKPAGTTLVDVEWQRDKYTEGVPEDVGRRSSRSRSRTSRPASRRASRTARPRAAEPQRLLVPPPGDARRLGRGLPAT